MFVYFITRHSPFRVNFYPINEEYKANTKAIPPVLSASTPDIPLQDVNPVRYIVSTSSPLHPPRPAHNTKDELHNQAKNIGSADLPRDPRVGTCPSCVFRDKRGDVVYPHHRHVLVTSSLEPRKHGTVRPPFSVPSSPARRRDSVRSVLGC